MKSQWYKFDQGVAGKPSSESGGLGDLFSYLLARVTIEKVDKLPDGIEEIQTTLYQDYLISNNAIEVQKIYIDNIVLNIYVDDMRAKLKLIEIKEEKAFFIYATIIIDNVSERNGSFELQKIRLCHNGKIISTTTYYATCISWIMAPIDIQKKERKIYKIYWVVDKKYEKVLFGNDLYIVYE